MGWEVGRECDPEDGRKQWGRKDWQGDVTCLAASRGRVFPGQEARYRLAVFAGYDDGHIGAFDGDTMEHEKSWLAHKDYGVNDIAAGLVKDSVLLFSGSLFGELICWHPAAFERAMTYQASAQATQDTPEGFTSAGGQRDTAFKQLMWLEGHLYTGDDAGKLSKWTSGLELVWQRNSYTPVWGLAVAGQGQELRSFTGSPIHSQVIVGDLKARSTDGSLPIHGMVLGRSPLAASPLGDFLICADTSVVGGLHIYKAKQGFGWGEATRLEGHTDQVSCISISPIGLLAASGGWDGRVIVWAPGELGTWGRQGEVLLADCYITSVCWGPAGELWAGGQGGRIVRIVNI